MSGLIEVVLVKRDSQGNKLHGQVERIGKTNQFAWLAERCENVVSHGKRGAARAAEIAKFYGDDPNEISFG